MKLEATAALCYCCLFKKVAASFQTLSNIALVFCLKLMLNKYFLCQAMLDEVDGPMNFTQMVTLFATKMAGGSDDDDVILASFEAFEQDGKIDAETFRAQLMTFGNKFSASEVDDAFAEFKIDDGQIDAAHLKGLMVSK